MAEKHIVKLTENEVVVKCYVTASSGGIINLSLQNDFTRANEVFSQENSKVAIRNIYWGLKLNKQLDISRIVPTDPSGVHGHYYLSGAGCYEFASFADNIYGDKDIRLTFDGPGHCFLVLGKTGWLNKIETSEFSIYDDITQVGQ